MIIDQNRLAKSRKLKRLQVGGLPLIHAIAKRKQPKGQVFILHIVPKNCQE